MDKVVEIAQVDRDAATPILAELNRLGVTNSIQFMEMLRQAFARHRLAALQSHSPSADAMREAAAGERFYIDCEFDGHGGPLLSLAIVAEDGEGIHISVDVAAMDLWVLRNVVPLMDRHDAPQVAKVYHNEVGGVIRAFLGNCGNPVIIADSPVDIARFCAAISTGEDGGWASTDFPRMTFEVHNVDCYPTSLPGAVQHNAWWDAMALRHLLRNLPIAGGSSAAGEAEPATEIGRLVNRILALAPAAGLYVGIKIEAAKQP